MVNLRKQDIIILSILLILTGLLRLPSLFEPYWHGDEGITLTVGQSISKGSILYRDIADNKTPLLYFIASVFKTLPLLKTTLFTWMMLTVVVFYFLARNLIPGKGIIWAGLFFVLLTCLPYMDGNIANGEIFHLLPNLLGVFLTWQSLEKPASQKFILAGVFFGIAFLFKHPAVFEMGAIILFLLAVKTGWSSFIRQISAMGLGFMIPNLLIILYFTLHDSLTYYWRFAFLGNFAYSSANNNSLIFKIVFIAVIVGLIFFMRKRLNKEVIIILLLLLFATVGSMLSARGYIHYYLPVISYLALILGYLFNFNKKVFLTIIVLLVGWRGVADFGAFHYQVKYYRNFIDYAAGKKDIYAYRLFFDPQVPETYLIADFLKSTPEERTFIWGDNPLIYALSEKRPVGRFSAAYNISFEKKRERETLRELEMHSPKNIIYLDDVRFILPGLDNFLIKNYNFAGRIGSGIIYERKI